MTVLVICIALNAALVFLLGFWVSVQRSIGDKVIYHGETLSPESGLAKAMRAHGNASEYAGVLIGIFVTWLVLKTMFGIEGATWLGWTAATITAGRYLHAIGCITCKTLAKPHPLKAIGAVLTYFGGLAFIVGMVLKVL